jgi:hypothetical protein
MAANISIIEEMFEPPSFIAYWHEIKSVYESMGFSDDLSDSQRIEEYSYIAEQVNKFVSSKKTQVLRHGDNLDRIEAEVEAIAAKLTDKASTRKQLVYIALRDSWVIQLHSNVQYLQQQRIEDDERY